MVGRNARTVCLKIYFAGSVGRLVNCGIGLGTPVSVGEDAIFLDVDIGSDENMVDTAVGVQGCVIAVVGTRVGISETGLLVAVEEHAPVKYFLIGL